MNSPWLRDDCHDEGMRRRAPLTLEEQPPLHTEYALNAKFGRGDLAAILERADFPGCSPFVAPRRAPPPTPENKLPIDEIAASGVATYRILFVDQHLAAPGKCEG
jgi:hypothetical protein